MKKYFVIITIIVTLFIFDVNAKDAIYSINKYTEEEFNFLENSYNDKGKIDGVVLGGSFLKEELTIDDNIYQDYQVMLVKYNKDGKLIWSFDYGKSSSDYINDISYSYNNDGNIDGYLILMNNTYNIGEEYENYPLLLKVDLNGELVSENLLKFDKEVQLNKILLTYDDNVFLGYILVGSINQDNKKIGFITKIDNDYNIIWSHEYTEDNYNEIEFKDIVSINENSKGIGLSILGTFIDSENKMNYKLLKYDNDGNRIGIIKEDFEEKDIPHLSSSDNGFNLYGLTYEVKLKNNKLVSYYIINYNSNSEENWEVIGNNSVNPDKDMYLYKLDDYLLLYSNDDDSSTEIVKISTDGVIGEKIKKINNEYYDMNSFLSVNNVLYIVGKIICPEEDNCGYDTNSLLLISTEDKVIEVKETDSGNVLFVSLTIVILIIVLILFRKYKKEKNKIKK